MKLKEITDLMGVTTMSVHRYRKQHPKLDLEDEKSKLGHCFPEPTHKDGRDLVWERKEVMDWYADNKQYVGSRAAKKPEIIITYETWCLAQAEILAQSRFLHPKVQSTDENDNEEEPDEQLDDLDMIIKTERLDYDDKIKLLFRTLEEAIYFRLKYDK